MPCRKIYIYLPSLVGNTPLCITLKEKQKKASEENRNL